MEIVTGYAGKKHVTANQQGCMNMGIIGDGDFILQGGQNLRAEIVTNNKIRIYDGDIVLQGRQAHIVPGTYDDVSISNGGQDVKRNDIIVARYSMNSDNGIESVVLAVVKGTPGTVATDPVITTGDIRSGDTFHEMALYRVRLDGLTVTAVERMATVALSIQGVMDKMTAETIANVPAASWAASTAPYTWQQTVSVPGMLSTTKVEVHPTHDGLTTADAIEAYDEAYQLLDCDAESVNGGLELRCVKDKPGINFKVVLEGIGG